MDSTAALRGRRPGGCGDGAQRPGRPGACGEWSPAWTRSRWRRRPAGHRGSCTCFLGMLQAGRRGGVQELLEASPGPLEMGFGGRLADAQDLGCLGERVPDEAVQDGDLALARGSDRIAATMSRCAATQSSVTARLIADPASHFRRPRGLAARRSIRGGGGKTSLSVGPVIRARRCAICSPVAA